MKEEKTIIQSQSCGEIEPDEMMSEEATAKFLKVSRITLLRWRNAEKIGCYRPGGLRVVYSKRNHIMPFLAACEKPAKSNNVQGANCSDSK